MGEVQCFYRSTGAYSHVLQLFLGVGPSCVKTVTSATRNGTRTTQKAKSYHTFADSHRFELHSLGVSFRTHGFLHGLRQDESLTHRDLPGDTGLCQYDADDQLFLQLLAVLCTERPLPAGG